MNSKKQKEKPNEMDDKNLNAQWQGVDKDPKEEKGKAEKVTTNDLKNKTVDADPEEENKKQ
jgi:hypothetical protein